MSRNSNTNKKIQQKLSRTSKEVPFQYAIRIRKEYDSDPRFKKSFASFEKYLINRVRIDFDGAKSVSAELLHSVNRFMPAKPEQTNQSSRDDDSSQKLPEYNGKWAHLRETSDRQRGVGWGYWG
ncbi:hypothetical protein FACS189421_02820 [Bacteroidia bacterium]|nr:hypothetical protein FACS189421_02820 [Bacteroidia bacterium]